MFPKGKQNYFAPEDEAPCRNTVSEEEYDEESSLDETQQSEILVQISDVDQSNSRNNNSMKTEISNVSVEEKAVEKKLTRNITLPLIEDDESIRSASNSTDSENEETLSELKQQSKLSISFNMNVADSELESIVECAKYVSSKSMEEIVIDIFPKLNKEIISIKNEVDRLFSFVKYINGKGAKILMEKKRMKLLGKLYGLMYLKRRLSSRDFDLMKQSIVTTLSLAGVDEKIIKSFHLSYRRSTELAKEMNKRYIKDLVGLINDRACYHVSIMFDESCFNVDSVYVFCTRITFRNRIIERILAIEPFNEECSVQNLSEFVFDTMKTLNVDFRKVLNFTTDGDNKLMCANGVINTLKKINFTS